jgi:tetratricopeptide (TPR) repeat protein
MKRESLAFALSGTFFGLIVGWIIATQSLTDRRETATEPAAPTPTASAAAPAEARPIDATRAARLEQQANAEPANPAVRVELGNLYFDAERFDQAIPWYEAAVKIDPKDANASTDLAVAYYYTNQIDRALAQLDQSLEVDPKHLKTLLNQGIILAFGKRDLAGAGRSWQRVVEIAPDSEEGRRARQGLDGLQSAAHGATDVPTSAAGSDPSSPPAKP